jgi:hypothetical protein
VEIWAREAFYNILNEAANSVELLDYATEMGI